MHWKRFIVFVLSKVIHFCVSVFLKEKIFIGCSEAVDDFPAGSISLMLKHFIFHSFFQLNDPCVLSLFRIVTYFVQVRTMARWIYTMPMIAFFSIVTRYVKVIQWKSCLYIEIVFIWSSDNHLKSCKKHQCSKVYVRWTKGNHLPCHDLMRI